MPCSFATEKIQICHNSCVLLYSSPTFVCHGVRAGWFQESTCCSSWDKLGNPTWWRTSELREPVEEKDLGEEAGNPGGIEPRPGEGWESAAEVSAIIVLLLHCCRLVTPKWPGILLLLLLLGSSWPGCRAPSHTPTELAPLTLKPWLILADKITLKQVSPIHQASAVVQQLMCRSRAIELEAGYKALELEASSRLKLSK